MRALSLNGTTAVDLLAQETPFLPGQTVAARAANGIVLQGADTAALLASDPVTLATFTTAAPAQTVNLKYRFVRVSTAAQVELYNN